MRAIFPFISFPSPLGWLLIAGGSGGICMVAFSGREEPSDDECREIIRKLDRGAAAERSPAAADLTAAGKAVLEYLTGGIPIPPLPLDTSRGTPFQQEVWGAIGRIPFGETRTYGEIARMIGRPEATRAVGQACGANPLPIVIPCHRVVGAGGRPGGYTGGIHIKETLLRLEVPGSVPGVA
jgi:O-6-methylguanine DNA methyltransferase